MKLLTAEQVLFIHARIISETGGSHGLRDLGLLESAIARPNASFEGKDLYLSLFDKAAALAHSLIKNHPFTDGNKRTGVAAAALFLRRNDYELSAATFELETITLKIAVENLSLEALANWFRDNSIRPG